MLVPLRPRALVIEHQAIVLMMLEDLLEAEGFTVIGATSGEEALEAARGTPPDLVLMDFRLDGELEGVDLLQKLQAILPSPLTAVVMSVRCLSAAERRALDEAAGGLSVPVLDKPIDTAELTAAITACGVGLRHRRAADALWWPGSRETTGCSATLSGFGTWHLDRR